MTGRSSRVVVVLALATLLLPGCRFDGLQFTADNRVEWITEDRSVVPLPLTLRWRLHDFEMVGRDGSETDDAGFVAIFMDRQPMAPFATLESLAEDDDACQASNGCPDLEWFNDRNVFPVEEGTTLVLDRLPLPGDDGRELRDFTLVLLDGQGRRQGESAFTIALEIDRTPRTES